MNESELKSMTRDGKSKLTSKYGAVNEQCDIIHAWMKKKDFDKMQQLKTLKEKI